MKLEMMLPATVRVRVPKTVVWGCAYNNGVVCGYNLCADCGWNPEVEAKRKAALRAIYCPEEVEAE